MQDRHLASGECIPRNSIWSLWDRTTPNYICIASYMVYPEAIPKFFFSNRLTNKEIFSNRGLGNVPVPAAFLCHLQWGRITKILSICAPKGTYFHVQWFELAVVESIRKQFYTYIRSF